MLKMLVVATALLRFGFVNSRASIEDQFDLEHLARIYSEDDMTAEFTEQLASHDHTRDMKRKDVTTQKYAPLPNEDKTTSKPATETQTKIITSRLVPEVEATAIVRVARRKNKTRSTNFPEVDVVDREDHFTQYLPDQQINTDSEITSLQATESEDERGTSLEAKEDVSFLAYLTGLEKAVEVDGAGSKPSDDIAAVLQLESQNIF